MLVHKNFAKGVLISPITASSTTITLYSGNGLKFPSLTGGDYTYITLRDVADTKREVCKLTGVSGDILTVVRGTPALSWSANDIAETCVVSEILPNQLLNTNSDVLFNTLTLSPTPTLGTTTTGQIWFDEGESTVSVDLGVSVLQVGQELFVRGRNTSGATIANGTVVFINGASGNKPLIAKAQSNQETSSFSTIGVATEDIANNSTGNVTTFGLVRGIDTSAWSEGSLLYLSATNAGQLTTTKPTYPNYVVEVARVARSHNTQGEILVSVNADRSALLRSLLESGNVVVAKSNVSEKASGSYSGSKVYADQHTTEAVAFTSTTTTGSSFVPAAKIRLTGDARTKTVSLGATQNADGTIDAALAAIDSSGSNQKEWLFKQNGDFVSPGDVMAYSDERLKSDWADVSDGLVEALASVKARTFQMNEQRKVGVSAQSLQAVLPEAVSEDEEGYLHLAYGNAALVACVALAKEVLRLRSLVDGQ